MRHFSHLLVKLLLCASIIVHAGMPNEFEDDYTPDQLEVAEVISDFEVSYVTENMPKQNVLAHCIENIKKAMDVAKQSTSEKHNIATPVKPFTDHHKKEVQCIATANYYEAANEGKRGMEAVSQVILNRMGENGFPTTACGVINQRTLGTCQFSWKCNKNLRGIDKTSQQWQTAYSVAKEMLVDGKRIRELGSALFFYRPIDRVDRGLVRVKQVGGHIFYTRRKHRTEGVDYQPFFFRIASSTQ